MQLLLVNWNTTTEHVRLEEAFIIVIFFLGGTAIDALWKILSWIKFLPEAESFTRSSIPSDALRNQSIISVSLSMMVSNYCDILMMSNRLKWRLQIWIWMMEISHHPVQGHPNPRYSAFSSTMHSIFF